MNRIQRKNRVACSHQSRTVGAVLFAALALAVLVPTSVRAQVPWTIQDYRNLVDNLLPGYGNGILEVDDGPDWLSTVTVPQIAAACQDLPPPGNVVQSGPLTVARNVADTKFIKIDLDRGRIRWANKTRRFDWMTSPHIAIGEGSAETILNSVADDLGIPSAERGNVIVDTRMGQHLVDGDFGATFERERMVSILRVINGLRVVESRMLLSISNIAEPARLLVLWPQFVLKPDLSLVPRATVLDTFAARLWEAEQGAEVELHVALAYMRSGFEYIPVAITQGDDEESGFVMAVPLVDIPADADFDGIPDSADNCPYRHNPRQEDRDSDGVGDLCDNCMMTPNPAQLDSDENGTGDDCEIAEGACLLTGLGCEVLPGALCATLGGTYRGDGTDCDILSEVSSEDQQMELNLQVHPNPFNPTVEISFSLAKAATGPVAVEILDLRGRLVRRLSVEDIEGANSHGLHWDGRDANGARLPSGVYFVRVRAGENQAVKKMALIK